MRLVKYLFYLSALIFPMGQLLSITILAYPEVRIHLLDVLVALTVVVWIAKRSTAKLFLNPKLSFLGHSILLFIGVGVLSLLVNIGNYELRQLIIGSLYLVRFVAYAGLFFVVRDLSALSTPGDLLRKTSGVLLVVVGVASAMLGMLQLFLYPNLRNLEYLGWDPHLDRAFGTFLDPQFLGIILVLTLIFLLGQDRTNKLIKIQKVRLFLAGIIFATLILTYSRSSYFALVVGLGILGLVGYLGKLGRLWYLGVLIAVILLFSRPKGVAGDLLRRESVLSRVATWKEAVEIWKEKPILGVGFNMLRYERSPLISHAGAGIDNSFLFILATTGIVGLAAYLNIWRKLLTKTSNLGLPIAGALFTHGLFNNTLFYPWVMWWVWVCFALFNPQANKLR